MAQPSTTTSSAAPGVPKAEAKPKPTRLADGRVLCLKLGSTASRGAYEQPARLYAGTFKQSDMTCLHTCGGRCLPGTRGGSSQ